MTRSTRSARRNIGDLVNAAHETWRAYNESAAGPCDDTVHGYYWDDDLPFLYFADVRQRAAYCAAHVLPLESMAPDLAAHGDDSQLRLGRGPTTATTWRGAGSPPATAS